MVLTRAKNVQMRLKMLGKLFSQGWWRRFPECYARMAAARRWDLGGGAGVTPRMFWHWHSFPVVVPGPRRALRRRNPATGWGPDSGNWRGLILGVVEVNMGDVVWSVNRKSEWNDLKERREGKVERKMMAASFLASLQDAGIRWGLDPVVSLRSTTGYKL